MTTYFAYGSNMHVARLGARVPSCVPIGPARLTGYRLAFHKRGRDGSGKCNIVCTGNAGDVVHGLLYELPDDELSALHRAEGFGYDQAWVTVSAGGRRRPAMLYLGRDEFVDEALRPYDWYKALVVAGARRAGLPPSYVTRIEQVAAVEDPDGRRNREHRRILVRCA